MARRGRKRQLELESPYWQLILSGAGMVEAYREVWIGRKTGYRWRADNGGLPPAGWPRRPARAGTCRCWNGSGSRRCTGTG